MSWSGGAIWFTIEKEIKGQKKRKLKTNKKIKIKTGVHKDHGKCMYNILTGRYLI